MTIRIDLTGDDALQNMVALDTALTCLSVAEFCAQLSPGEIQHAQTMIRNLRAKLLRARADYISNAVRKSQ